MTNESLDKVNQEYEGLSLGTIAMLSVSSGDQVEDGDGVRYIVKSVELHEGKLHDLTLYRVDTAEEAVTSFDEDRAPGTFENWKEWRVVNRG